MPPQSRAHTSSFDARSVLQQHQMATSHLQDTPPYTPRSKSLDLLRSDAVSPVPSRTSLDTLSTLRGHRISSPIFVNSSIGVKPLPGEPRHLDSPTIHETDLDEEGQIDNFASRTTDANLKIVANTAAHDPMILRYVAGARTIDNALQPKTPSRRQKSSDNLLKSKFSMSPVQTSKRSKIRNSQDRSYATFSVSNRLSEGVSSQENARSTFGNWSHSLGMAARKLQKSALPRKASDESYQSQITTTTTTMLEVDHEVVNETLITPEKAKVR